MVCVSLLVSARLVFNIIKTIVISSVIWYNCVIIEEIILLLHYKLSGKDCLVSDDLIAAYKKGSKPSNAFTQEEFDEVITLFKGLPKTLEEDYESSIFSEYSSYKTSTGFVIDTMEKAIIFNNFHESLHLGVIMSLRKLV